MSNARFSIIPAKAVQDPNLTAAELRTLAALGLYADKEGWCWPAQATLAELTGVSRQTTNAHIKKLVNAGYINVHHRTGKGGAQIANKYQLRFDFRPTLSAQDDTPVKPGRQGVSNNSLTGGVKPGLDTNTPVNTPKNDAPTGAELNSHQKRTAAAIGRGIQGHRSIEEEVQRHLHIRLRNNKTHGKLIQFLKRRREEGQTVEAFAKWWRADWRGKDGAPPNPMQIMDFWPAAFAEKPAAKEPQFTEVWE